MGQYTAYAAVSALTIAANLAIAVADLTRARFVLANSAEVHVPQSWLPRLAALKVAGAVGLLVGLAVPVIAGRSTSLRTATVMRCHRSR